MVHIDIPRSVEICVWVLRITSSVWIITVGHRLFAVQNGLTAHRYRCARTSWPDKYAYAYAYAYVYVR